MAMDGSIRRGKGENYLLRQGIRVKDALVGAATLDTPPADWYGMIAGQMRLPTRFAGLELPIATILPRKVRAARGRLEFHDLDSGKAIPSHCK